VADNIDVKIGQEWEDLDCRQKGRKILVLEIDGKAAHSYAVVRTVGGSGMTSRIRLDRMRPSQSGKKGFRLVTDASREAQDVEAKAVGTAS
jgi:hypothetical protein